MRVKVTSLVLCLTLLLGALTLFASASSTPAQNENPLQINMPEFEDSDFVKYFLFARWDSSASKFTNVQLVVLTSDLFPFTADLSLLSVTSGSDVLQNVQARIMPAPSIWEQESIQGFNITRYIYNVDDGNLQSFNHYVNVFDGSYRIYLNEGYKNGVANRNYFRTFGSPYTFTDNNYPMHLLPVLFNHNLDWFKTLHDDLSVKLLNGLIQIKNTLHTDIVNTNNTLSRIENALSTEITLTRNIYNFLTGTLIAYVVSIDDHLSDIEDVAREIESKLFEEEETVNNGVNSEASTDAAGLQGSVSLPSDADLNKAFDSSFGIGSGSDGLFHIETWGFVRQAFTSIAFDDTNEFRSSMGKITVMISTVLAISIAFTFWRRATD